MQNFGSVALSRNSNWKDKADAGLEGVQVAASGDSTLSLGCGFQYQGSCVQISCDLFANIIWLSSLLILTIFFLQIISKTVYFLINLLGLGQNLCKTSGPSFYLLYFCLFYLSHPLASQIRTLSLKNCVLISHTTGQGSHQYSIILVNFSSGCYLRLFRIPVSTLPKDPDMYQSNSEENRMKNAKQGMCRQITNKQS